MSEWPTVRFGDLFQIKHGFAFKGEHFSDEPGPIVLTPGNFEAGGGLKLRPGKDRSYNGEFPEAFKLKAGELLVVMTDLTQEAAILGAPAIVPSDIACLHNQRLGKIIDVKADRLDLRFLYYLCNTHEYREYLRSTATGSTVKHTSPTRIYDFAVSLPPIETQRRIAGILGAYDDLIQVNRRRITVLEEMARGLFTEWFVRLRFPGHEDVAIEDTPDGPLPVGWSWGTLGDFLTLQRGFDLPSAQRVDGAFPIVSASGVSGSHAESRVSGPGVATGRSGTIGQVHLVMGDFWPLNTALYVKAFKKAGPAYATLLLRHVNLSTYSTGSAVPTLNRNHVHGVKLVIAPSPLLTRFEQIAMTNFKAAAVIRHESETLAAARDLLLPRLISGQLSVAQAEQELKAA